MENSAPLYPILYIWKLIELMHDFQNENTIRSRCMENCQILRDSIVNKFPNFQVTAKSVILVGETSENSMAILPQDIVRVLPVSQGDNLNRGIVINLPHLIVEVNGIILDPSFETFSLTNKRYFESFDSAREYCQERNLNDFVNHLSEQESQIRFNEFNNHAELLNSNSRWNFSRGSSSRQYCGNQLDYIEPRFSIMQF